MPRKSNRVTRSNRPKKAAKKVAMKTPYAGKYATKPRPAKTKLVVRQESLGQQTQNKVSLPSLGKHDSRAKYIKAISMPSTYLFTKTFAVTSPTVGGVITTGRQGVASRYIAVQSDLRLIAESLQNILATGSSSSGSPINQPARFLLESIDSVYDFSNRSTAPCTLKIYIVTNKRDTWQPPGGQLNNYMTYNSPNGASVYWNGYPVDAFRAGVQASADPFQSSSIDDAWLNPGVVPTASPVFNQYFKIEKEIEVELSTGGVHQLDLHLTYDKMIDATVYANTPLVGARGVTRFLLFCATGTPVLDTSGGMTTSGVDIGCIETMKYKYTQAWSPAGINFQNDDTPLIQETATSSVQINAGSGAASNVAYA